MGGTQRLRLLGFFTFLMMGCAAEGRPIAAIHEELTVCANGPTLNGIDVSHWQGKINWDAVKGDGISFAIIRASHGTGTIDKEFDRNWAEAKRVGIKRGVYQYFEPGQDPVAQANLMLDMMGPFEPGDLPPVIDVETTGGLGAAAVVASITKWIQTVEAATGVKPMIYSGLYFWKDNVGNSTAFKDYPFWIAQYGRQCPDLPSAWSDWVFFQTSDSGKVAGISGDVDTNLFNGDMTALEAFAGGMTQCGDGVCNGGENGATCQADCPVCESVTRDGRIIDNGDLCLELGGNITYWREAAAGHGGSLRWTYTTDKAEAANFCAWNLDFDASGRYKLEVHTPAPYSQSKQAAYEVGHDGEVSERKIDQGLVDGWISLGEFRFAVGPDQYVFLGDNTGEHNDRKVQLVCDALRVTPIELDDDGAAPPPKGQAPTTGNDKNAWSGGGELGGGCSAAPGKARGGAWLLLGVALLGLRRRRLR
ncbi:MAG: hypothetical protein KC416_00175 [Myxococcales bacterium]|nr:hypothetical protein [Myxococcales bacterium]